MFTRRVRTLMVQFVGSLSILSGAHGQGAGQSEREAMYYRYLEFPSYVKGGSIQPHWMVDGSSFWYAEGAPGNAVIWKIDPVANTKTPLFDAARLRKALTPLLEHEPPYQGLPFEEFTFVDKGENAVKFTVEGKEFILQLDTYTVRSAPVLSEEEKNRLVPQASTRDIYAGGVNEVPSPDGRWFVGVKDYNLWLRSAADGRSVQLTSDGVKDHEWIGRGWRYEAKWSPDSSKLAVTKTDYRKVPKIPIVRYLGPTEEVSRVNHPEAALLAQTQLFIIDIVSKERIRVDTGDEADQLIFSLGWRPRGAELLFLRVDREFKQVDLMAAGAETGATRVVLRETQKAFVLKAFFDMWFYERQLGIFILLEDGEQFVWVSERDGWKHLYLYDMNGNLIRRLTEGSYPVIQVVDENADWVYLTAHGDPQRPYDTHLYRVSLQGKEFTRLTEGTGQHRIEFAPSKQFFLDAHSGVDRPPVVELRRADGAALQMVSEANLEALRDLKWRTPEEFVVKAADGKTDLYGVLYKPYDFDASKKYPVIEVIYGGPWGSEVVRSTFIPQGWSRTALRLAPLGFITFVVDGRGTPERGREFDDAVYASKGRYLISDHVAALKQLAEKRPYIDLSRVGIFGHSFGGYMALRAILTAPDVYHVAVASAPNLDLSYLYSSSGNLGLSEKNRELDEYASNLRSAGNLKGKLLLIHGTSDVMAPFSNTMKMVEALIRAEKPFDLLVLPDQPHDIWSRVSGKTYWRERMRRYFQEHLNPE